MDSSPSVNRRRLPTTTATTTETTTRTILRIKRRRTEEPVSCLRLEGVARVPTEVGDDYGDEDGTLTLEEQNYLQKHHRELQQQQPKVSSNRKRSSAVLWKRFDPNDNKNNTGDEEQREDASSSLLANQRCYRIVNAVLTNDDPTEEEMNARDAAGQSRHSKRRKLMVLDTATTASSSQMSDGNRQNLVTSPLHSLFQGSTGSNIPSSPTKKKKKNPLKILDPLTRIVDDSLQEVLAGSRSSEAHFHMLTTDTRFTLQDPIQQRQWMTWCHSSGGGNLLHCCALWNDASTAHLLLQHCQQHCTHHSSNNSNNNATLSLLVETTDADGRTPYEVAQLVGHKTVCQVLEAYGGDTSNYVYDIFYLDNDENNNHQRTSSENSGYDAGRGPDTNSDKDDDGDEAPIMTAELVSGVGYWTPEGELILEANEKNARSLSHETEGDIDSNCEEYGANDYPEDEEEDGDEFDDMRRMHQYPHQHLPWRYDDDYEDFDEDFDEVLYQVNDDDQYDVYDWEDDLQE
ncbi:hypothetical protein IV203_031083 [Nitzschia inconspicua]|uniref:Uncharacterized protein n=1 Tax=Nitzschia inconspicua TaxID=303405 RepID=A0A9K3LUW2_9STRA|nr:hypothetical protein IV203_031083 [Nitzschia inconspicua]